MTGPKPAAGPLALVIESGMPDAYRSTYRARGAIFLNETQALVAVQGLSDNTKTIWIDDSISAKARKAIEDKVNGNRNIKDRIALYVGSSSLTKLRDMLDRRLPPLPAAKISEEEFEPDDSSGNGQEAHSELQLIVERLRVENERLRLDLQSAQEASERAQCDRDRSASQIATLVSELWKTKAELAAARSPASGESKQLRVDFDAAHRRIQELEGIIRRINDELKKTRAELAEARDGERTELAALRVHYSRAQRDLERLREELRVAKELPQVSDVEAKASQDQGRELKDLKAELSKSKADVLRLKRLCAAVRSLIEDNQKHYSELERQLEKFERELPGAPAPIPRLWRNLKQQCKFWVDLLSKLSKLSG